MILEIIEDKEFNKPTWYILKLDGLTIDVSRDLEFIQELYNKVKADPSIAISTKIVLKSEEI